MENQNLNVASEKAKMNWAFWFIGFFLPPLGCVFYGIWQNKKPNEAISSGWGTLFGIVLYIVLFLVFVLFLKPLL